MNTKVKGDKIKDGSIPMSALSTEIKNKIENAGAGGGGADWNAQKGKAGYIENRTHRSYFTSIGYDQDNNKGIYETINTSDKLLLLYKEKYYTIYKNTTLTIDDEDTFIVNYDGTTLFITDEYGSLKYEYKNILVSETNIPLSEVFIPDTVIKTTPQTLSNTDKNQALANLGIDRIRCKYLLNPWAIDDTLFDAETHINTEVAPQELCNIIDNNYSYALNAFLYMNDADMSYASCTLVSDAGENTLILTFNGGPTQVYLNTKTGEIKNKI